MRWAKTKSPGITLLQELLGQFVDQIERGVNPIAAGWIEKPALDSVVATLVEKGLCERTGDRVRIAPRPIPAEVLTELDSDGKWLADVHTEMIVATEIVARTMKIYGDGTRYPALAFIGWARMLETSYFPVIVDRVLRENFSVDGWFINAKKFAPELSATVVKKWWSQDELDIAFRRLYADKPNVGALRAEQVLNYLRRVSPPRALDKPDNEVFERVSRVLNWDTVLEILEKDDVLSLGLLWSVDHVIADLNYPESLTFIEKKAWAVVEKIVNKKAGEIGDGVVKAIERIGRATSETDATRKRFEIANWDNIIRLPW